MYLTLTVQIIYNLVKQRNTIMSMTMQEHQAIVNLSTVSILCCSSAELAQHIDCLDDADIAFLEEFADWARFKAVAIRQYVESK